MRSFLHSWKTSASLLKSISHFINSSKCLPEGITKTSQNFGKEKWSHSPLFQKYLTTLVKFIFENFQNESTLLISTERIDWAKIDLTKQSARDSLWFPSNGPTLSSKLAGSGRPLLCIVEILLALWCTLLLLNCEFLYFLSLKLSFRLYFELGTFEWNFVFCWFLSIES